MATPTAIRIRVDERGAARRGEVRRGPERDRAGRERRMCMCEVSGKGGERSRCKRIQYA